MELENERLLAERLKRISTAVALEQSDRVPVVLEYSGFAAYVTGHPCPHFWPRRPGTWKR